MAHATIWLTLELARIPEGLKNILRSTCWFGSARSVGGTLLFYIWRGVLQGCPLSGVIDPLLRRVRSEVDARGLGSTHACSDDLGRVVKDLRSLVLYKDTFATAARVAALRSKTQKFFLVPLAGRLSLDLAPAHKEWLQANAPEFADLLTRPVATRLGFFLGLVVCGERSR